MTQIVVSHNLQIIFSWMPSSTTSIESFSRHVRLDSFGSSFGPHRLMLSSFGFILILSCHPFTFSPERRKMKNNTVFGRRDTNCVQYFHFHTHKSVQHFYHSVKLLKVPYATFHFSIAPSICKTFIILLVGESN